MRKLYCILLCGFIILSVLGCADKDTFAGANREERIIMSLEKTYPEHTFQIVKPYDKYNGNYYAVCEDEKGIQFKVHTIMYDNRYHFGCYDQYLVEIEKKGNFINKTAEIAKKHGYDIRYDEDNQTLALVIDVDHTVDTSDVTETIVESVMFPLAEPPSEEAVQHLRGNVFDVFFCCGVPYLRTGYVCGLPALSSAHADRGGYSPENEG